MFFCFRNTLVNLKNLVYNKLEVILLDSYVVIVLIFGILIFLLLVVLFFVNRLILYRNRVIHSLEVVHESLLDRVSFIDRIHSFILEKIKHEEKYLKKLDSLKKEILEEHDFVQYVDLLRKSDKILNQFLKMDEVYSFLKKDNSYLELVDEITLNQERIVYAMENYDKGVRDYNNYQGGKFISFISKLFRFPAFSYYNQ